MFTECKQYPETKDCSFVRQYEGPLLHTVTYGNHKHRYSADFILDSAQNFVTFLVIMATSAFG